MKVHFTVDFDGLTNRAREFWAERKYAFALHEFLCKGCNLSEEKAKLLLAGRLKMAQLPGGKMGVDGTLVKDTWRPDSTTFYPNPMMGVEYANTAVARYLAETEVRKLRKDLAYAVDEIARLTAPPQKTTVDRFIERQMELEKRPTPKPDTTYKSNMAWVLPDGKFYPCKNSMEHIWLAERLGKTEKEAEESGWVKISHTVFGLYIFSQKRTQRQMDTLFAWMQADEVMRKRAYDEWMKSHD